MTATVTVRLADGTARPAPLTPAGDGGFYACPWCQAPVFSPEAWQEHERINADACARRGEAYQPEPCPSSIAEAWEASGCPDPACLVNLPAGRLADALRRREEAAARQQEREDRERRARQYAETRDQRHREDEVLWARTQAGAGTGNPGGDAPARRGDLIVVREHDPGYGGGVPSDSYTVGVVTSVTRDGTVKAYRPAGDFPEPDWQGKVSKGTDLARRRPDRTWVLSARAVDVPGALAAAACHTWPRDEHLARPFESMQDVHGALRPHLVSSQPGAREALSAAAGLWEQARRQARELRPPLSARGEEFARAHEAYAAAAGAANDAYRRAVSAAVRGTGDSPAPESGSGKAIQARRAGSVAVAWKELISATAGFEPEDDARLMTWMAGEAAGMTSYAEAVTGVHETAVNTVGLDPAAMQALHECAEAAAGAAKAMSGARARFAVHYQAVRELAAAGGMLPFDGRWITGEGG